MGNKTFRFVVLMVCAFASLAWAQPQITDTYLSPGGSVFSAGDVIATFSGVGVTISQGDSSYQINGQNVELTVSGAALVNGGDPFPVLGLTDGDGSVYLISKHFPMSDDLEVGTVSGTPRVRDLSTMLVRTRDATANNHLAAYFKSSVSLVASGVGDRVVSARFNLFVDSGNSAVAGQLALFGLKDNAWDESSLTYENRPYTAATPVDGDVLDAALSYNFGAVAVTTNVGEKVSFDLSAMAELNGDLSFLLLSNDETTVRHYVASSEASDTALQPFISVSYTTDTLVGVVDDSLTVKEGGISLLSPVRLMANDSLFAPSAVNGIESVNGTAWASLPDSTHDAFIGRFGYKQVSGLHGTLYLRETGLAYYEHGGSNIEVNTADTFTYAIYNDEFVSASGSVTVNLTPGNQAPVLTLGEKNFIPGSAAAAEGDIAATFSVSDPDGDATQVYWLSVDGIAPTNSSGNAYYTLDREAGAVRLTAVGAEAVNALEDLPPVSLGAYDSASDRKSCFKTVTPYVAKGGAYYVDKASGDDSNDGLSLVTAFASVEAALSLVVPDDTIFIVGEYSAPDFNESYAYDGTVTDPYIWRNAVTTIKVRKVHGEPGAPITLKAWDDQTIVKTDDTAGILVDQCSHIRVIGFEVEGAVGRMSVTAADALQFLYRVDTDRDGYARENYDNFITNDGAYDYFYRVPFGSTPEYVEEHYSQSGTLPLISGSQRPVYTATLGILARGSQYVDILNNHVHHIPNTGLRAQASEYVNIIGNEVDNTTRKASVGTMGIVARETTHNIPVLEDSSNLYKIVIANNRVHHIYNEVYSWVPTKTFIWPHLDEGKGISLEWQTDTNWVAEAATGRILMANNVTYLNALSGVNCHATDRVDMLHNISFLNSLYGTVFELESGPNIGITHEADVMGGPDLGTDVRCWNNISVIDGSFNGLALRVNVVSQRVAPGFVVYDGGGNLVWEYQGGEVRKSEENVADGLFLADADPLFLDPENYDFRIPSNSPGIDAALPLTNGWNLPNFVGKDILSTARPVADVGALEYIAPLVGYQAWMRDQLSDEDYGAGTLLDPLDDFDGDQVINILEYAFGTSPDTADSAVYQNRVLGLTPNADGTYVLSFARSGSERIDIRYRISESLNLTEWSPLESADFGISQSQDASTVRETWEKLTPWDPPVKNAFYRIEIIQE
ncbi:DNRLRE domain-containing protein [Verrucomicrobiota bacterium]